MGRNALTPKTWVYSDPHFYHSNICKFTNYDGSPVRPWDDAEKMTEDMISMYNEDVSDDDRVYILGDVAFSKQLFVRAVSRLKGRKVLVIGNHDPKKMTQTYADLGIDVRGYVQRSGWIMSHIPIHPASLGRWKLNIHGHLHNNTVKLPIEYGDKLQEDDERYYCACVERTNFRPKLLSDILQERSI